MNAVPEKKRKVWPWVLGGCLTLIVLVVVGFGLLAWWGVSKVGDAMNDTVAQIPVVTEHFGSVNDVSVDWAATGASGGAMVLNIDGSKGKGTVKLEVDQATSQFKRASITLPNGEVLELDAAQLQELQQLQEGLPQG